MKEEILNHLAETVGTAVGPGTYAKIEEWLSWWRGTDRSFHYYWENGAGGYPIRRELFRLNMAKKICEDWAALLMNDRTYLSSPDEATSQWLASILRPSFFRAVNRLVEKAFASGTGACLLRLDDAAVDGFGFLAPGPHGPSFSFDFVDASHIVPLTVRRGEIVEAAFVSEVRERGEEVLYLETHTLEQDGYRIRNERFRLENGLLSPETASGGLVSEVRTGSFTPFFAILTPNLVNAAEEGCGLGVSVFADAIDCLKGVDLAFNNYCRDIKLGGKKVFLNQSLILRDDAGNVYTPDDVAQQLFVTIGDTDLAENPMIVEHNPELRSAENAEAVQDQLDYLSFRCGLGTHHYQFSRTQGQVRLTATQYTGERQDLRQNTAKHAQNLADFLLRITEALLWVGRTLYHLPLSAEPVTVRFDDSYLSDTESERGRDLAEVNAGIMTKEEFRKKWYEA